MDMEYLSEVHFPSAYQPVRSLNKLAQSVGGKISEEPWETAALRAVAIATFGCTKSQFDGALKKLQITMNVVRLNHPQAERDTWVPFSELYFDVWRRYVDDLRGGAIHATAVRK